MDSVNKSEEFDRTNAERRKSKNEEKCNVRLCSGSFLFLISGVPVAFGLDEFVMFGVDTLIYVNAGTSQGPNHDRVLLDYYRLLGNPQTGDVNITIGDVNANPGDELMVTGEDHLARVYAGTGTGNVNLDPILLDWFQYIPDSWLSAGLADSVKVAVGDVFLRQAAAVIDLDPDTLNLKSKGKYVTAYVYDENGTPLSVASADIVAIEGINITPISEERTDGNMVKFLRSALIDELRRAPLDASDDLLGEVDISIKGKTSSGVFEAFKGTATIRVIDGNRKGN